MRIIAGEARGRHIEAPQGKHTRPTLDRVRENMFNMLQYDIPGSRVLDLFAGSGALSLESLSRGAESAVLVDFDRNASAVQKSNIRLLGYERKTRVFPCDWRTALMKLCSEKALFDIVFLDPPYAMTDLHEVFSELPSLLAPEALIVLEHEAGKVIAVPSGFTIAKDRSWGFCAVSVYQFQQGD